MNEGSVSYEWDKILFFFILNRRFQGSKNPLVRSYLRVPQAAGQVKLWMISNVN